MRKAVFRSAVALLVGLGATTVGCMAALASPTARRPAPETCTPVKCTAPAADAKANAILRLATIGAPGKWDPHNGRSPAQDQIYMSPVYDALLQLDGEGAVRPELATSYKMSPDQKSLTLQLRTGVKFHDGTPFNADAVVANENYALATGGLGATLLKANGVTSVTATGPYTVVFTLSAPNPTFPINVAYDYAIGGMVSPTVLKNNPESLATTPAGSGPYTLESSNVTTVTYKKVPSYWNVPQWKQLPLKVQFQQITDDNTRLAAFETGQIDGSYIQLPLAGLDNLIKNSGGNIVKYTSDIALGNAEIQLNYKTPALQNVKVRQAMSYAIDRKAICDKIFLRLCTPALQPFSKGTIAYDPKSEWTPASYNPTKARQLLAESGVPGSQLSLTLLSSNEPLIQRLSAFLQSQLNSVGFNITLVPVASTLSVTQWQTGQQDMWVSTVSGNPNLNGLMLDNFITPVRMPGGTDPGLVPVFNRADQQLLGTKQRATAFQKVAAYIAQNAVNIVLGHVPATYLVKSYVGGMDTMVTAQIGIAYQIRYLYVRKH